MQGFDELEEEADIHLGQSINYIPSNCEQGDNSYNQTMSSWPLMLQLNSPMLAVSQDPILLHSKAGALKP